MPDKLCKFCAERAELAYNFKITLEQSDSTLRGFLFKDQMKDPKKNAFPENNYLMSVKTEIAFVDADPFLDDDSSDNEVGEPTDYPPQTAENENEENYNAVQNYSQDFSQQEDTPKQEEPIESRESLEKIDEEIEYEEEDDENDEDFIFDMASEKSKKSKSPEGLIIDKVEYIKDGDGKYVCQICNKKLCDKKGLNLHIRLHTGEKLKRCNICNRGFIKSDHLKRHLLVHEKSISCDQCEEVFDNRQDFKIHMKDVHDENDVEVDKPKK